MALRLLGIGAGDEVIVPAYTYTASASIVDHVGAKIVFVDIQDGCLEMDYNKVEAAITERTKAIIPVDLAGIPCDYDRLKAIWEAKKDLFTPKTDLQKKIGRVAICADCAHSFGARRNGKMAGANDENVHKSSDSRILSMDAKHTILRAILHTVAKWHAKYIGTCGEIKAL